LNDLKPDVLVICCTYCLPALFRLRRRPPIVIYYSVESISYYGSFDAMMNRHAGPLVDAVIFPEENRAALETERYGFEESAKVVMFNCVKRREERNEALPALQRNGKILYSGTISHHTLANYFLDENIRTIPMDLFGPIKAESEAERLRFTSLNGEVSYRGHLSAKELASIRKLYAYSIVMWNPINENQYYAAPNKFFESIADGVPPISAPHPQCKLIIGRYQCGILMRDWSFEEFCNAIGKAREIYGTAEWEKMVDGCLRAVNEELTWDAQFEKLKQRLPGIHG
jgi:glycosyltransferase involved in cell wall biosynthesis